MAADYSAWKKAGVVLLPCRVVGLALELLFKAKSEYDLSLVGPEHCASVELWKTQHLGRAVSLYAQLMSSGLCTCSGVSTLGSQVWASLFGMQS